MTKRYGYQDRVRVDWTTLQDKLQGVLEADQGVVQDRTPSAHPDVFFKHLGKVVTLSARQLKDGVTQ